MGVLQNFTVKQSLSDLLLKNNFFGYFLQNIGSFWVNLSGSTALKIIYCLVSYVVLQFIVIIEVEDS